MEDNEHFLLHCPQFDVMRQDLLGQLSVISGLNIDLDDKPLCDLLLFGDSKNSVIINRIILEATISFIKTRKGVQIELKHEKAATFSFIFSNCNGCLVKKYSHLHRG